MRIRALAPQIKGQPHTTIKPFGLSFDVDNPNAIKWAQEHAAELAVGLSDTSRDDIADAIEDSLSGEIDRADTVNIIMDAVGNEDRAEMIARTETMTAANEGQRQSWSQAQAKGWLPEDARKKWIAFAGCCDDCDELDGVVVAIDDSYPGDGEDGPPLHPNCRCSESITEKPLTEDEDEDEE